MIIDVYGVKFFHSSSIWEQQLMMVKSGSKPSSSDESSGWINMFLRTCRSNAGMSGEMIMTASTMACCYPLLIDEVSVGRYAGNRQCNH
jgi:hypothetical protein